MVGCEIFKLPKPEGMERKKKKKVETKRKKAESNIYCNGVPPKVEIIVKVIELMCYSFSLGKNSKNKSK